MFYVIQKINIHSKTEFGDKFRGTQKSRYCRQKRFEYNGELIVIINSIFRGSKGDIKKKMLPTFCYIGGFLLQSRAIGYYIRVP